MKTETFETLIDEMDDLLDTERKALTRGDLSRATALVDHKEKLVQRLAGLSTEEAGDLPRLHDKIIHNQALLDGALQGMRHVFARLTALSKVQRQLETYGEDGRRHTIEGQVVRKVEKRA